MARESLALRLYFQPCFYQLARLVGYDGLAEQVMNERLKPLRERFGDADVGRAIGELLVYDEAAKKYALTPQARKVCRALLGVPPEEWSKDEPVPAPTRKRRQKR